jgi:site-specific recombinase XerD
MPTDSCDLTRGHVETFISVQVERHRPKTASIGFGDLQHFFRWSADEREIDYSPMTNVTRPRIPEEPPPILTEQDIRALLRTCNGTGFEELRDAAIIRLFVDSGMRPSELARLSVDEIDLM